MRIADQAKPTKKALKAARKALRVELARRGLSWAGLARLIGVKRTSVLGVAYGNARSLPVQRRIEITLGKRFFTPVQDFSRLERLRAILGFDPVLAKNAQIEAFARNAGIKGSVSKCSRAALLDMIEQHFSSRAASAAQPQPAAQKTAAA